MASGQFEFFQLRCFVAVAEELNFRRAAARLNMTQPPLSRQIKLLEHGIGVKLFERSSRQVLLTPAGTSFLSSATDILQRAEHAVLSARQAERGEVGAIAMGFVPSAAIEFIPRIVSALQANLPGITVNPMEMMSYEIIEALISGQLDLGLSRSTGRREELESVRVVSEQFVLALPKDHPLAGRRDLALADLDGIDYIGYSTERGGFIRDVHAALFAAEGVRPNIVLEVSQTQTIIALVNAGIGAALVPNSSRATEMSQLVYRGIALPDRVRSDLYLMIGPKRQGLLHQRVRNVILSELEGLILPIPA